MSASTSRTAVGRLHRCKTMVSSRRRSNRLPRAHASSSLHPPVAGLGMRGTVSAANSDAESPLPLRDAGADWWAACIVRRAHRATRGAHAITPAAFVQPPPVAAHAWRSPCGSHISMQATATGHAGRRQLVHELAYPAHARHIPKSRRDRTGHACVR